LIQIDNNNIRINVLGSDTLHRSKRFKAGPLLKINFSRDESDNADLSGLGEVGTSLEIGVFSVYNF